MPNLYDPEWEFEATAGEMVLRVAQIVARAGGERLGGTLYELEPGGTAVSPLHFHRANEELLIVVTGRPSVRSPESERVCEPGELVAFPAGPAGAHQVVNRSEEPARVLILSTLTLPDVVEHPDSDKLLAITDAGLHAFPRSAEVSPTLGELDEPPEVRPVGAERP